MAVSSPTASRARWVRADVHVTGGDFELGTLVEVADGVRRADIREGVSLEALLRHGLRPPELKVRTQAHTIQLGWYVEFESRVRTHRRARADREDVAAAVIGVDHPSDFGRLALLPGRGTLASSQLTAWRALRGAGRSLAAAASIVGVPARDT